MRVDDVRQSGLLDTWQRSIVDDGPIRQAVKKLDLEIRFSPSLVMVNRESCTFGYVNRWVTRMLTWSRLYESTFFLSMLHAVFSNAVMGANFGLLIYSAAVGNGIAFSVALVGLILSGILSVAAYVESRRCAQHSCELRGETLPPLKPVRITALFWLVAVGQAIYGIDGNKSDAFS